MMMMMLMRIRRMSMIVLMRMNTEYGAYVEEYEDQERVEDEEDADYEEEKGEKDFHPYPAGFESRHQSKSCY